MSIAAALFHSTDVENETLHRRIMPSDEQRTAQSLRWNELAEYLSEWLKEKTGFNVKTWIQGSYKFGTQVRPARMNEEFDIDLGVYLEWSGNAEDEMDASVLKGHVQSGIVSYAAVADGVTSVTVPPKERCARISYADHFHIDVPGYHFDSDRDIRSLATQTLGWEASDPKALVVWFRENVGDDDDRTQLRRVVRYLKTWAALKFELSSRPSSIMLTVLATNAFQTISKDLTDDDDVLEAVICKVVQEFEADTTVQNPVDTSENLNRLSDVDSGRFLDQLQIFHETATRAIAATTLVDASDIWTEAFEHFFPAPDQDETDGSNSSHALIVVKPIDVQVTATPRSGFGRTYRGTNAIGPIPKDCDIKFHVLTPLPPMTQIRWVVRNSGSEADDKNDLGHCVQERDITTSERSAYNGTHFMDCIAREDGRLIGYRRVQVIINDGVGRNPYRPNLIKYYKRRR